MSRSGNTCWTIQICPVEPISACTPICVVWWRARPSPAMSRKTRRLKSMRLRRYAGWICASRPDGVWMCNPTRSPIRCCNGCALPCTTHRRYHDPIEHNKQNVLAFHDLMFNQCQPAEAIERYVGDVFIQHNPAVADGKQAFIAYFMRMAQEYLGKRVHWMTVARSSSTGMCSSPPPSSRPTTIRCSDTYCTTSADTMMCPQPNVEGTGR